MEMMGNKRTIQLKEPEPPKPKPPITGFSSNNLPIGMPRGISSRLDDDDLTLGGDRFSDLREEEYDLLQGVEEDVDDGTEVEAPPNAPPMKPKKEPSELAKAAATLAADYKRLTDGVNTHVDFNIPITVRVYLNSWNPTDSSDIDVEIDDDCVNIDFDVEVAKKKAVKALKSNLEKDWEKLKQQINDIAFKFRVDFDDVVMVMEDPNWEWADYNDDLPDWQKSNMPEPKRCWHGLLLKDCKPCQEDEARAEDGVQ